MLAEGSVVAVTNVLLPYLLARVPTLSHSVYMESVWVVQAKAKE